MVPGEPFLFFKGWSDRRTAEFPSVGAGPFLCIDMRVVDDDIMHSERNNALRPARGQPKFLRNVFFSSVLHLIGENRVYFARFLCQIKAFFI